MKIKHGLSRSRIYRIYQTMKLRCKPNAICHKRYYDRGIKVCDEWKNENGFINFYQWSIQNGYQDNLSIDRIDNNGIYEPKNCRWVTPTEQMNNTSINHWITIDNETRTLSQWSKKTGIPISSISRNEQKGLKNKQILTVKYHRKKSKIAQYDLKGNLIKIWNSPIEAQKVLNLPQNYGISNVCKHRTKTSYGYGWSYYPEDVWKPKETPNLNEKRYITIDGETHDYKEWAKILNITRDSFRRICRETKLDPQKLSERKNKLLKSK